VNANIEPIPGVEEVVSLLVECGLPVADISPEKPPMFFGVRAERGLIAVIGLELLGEVALLRSLAVAPTARGQHLGHDLVAFAERVAAERGVETLFLLTETAAKFFTKLGYRLTDRSDAPPAVRSTAQFASLCPASSVFLCKAISGKK
jgi:amino-acid N-acetyltransferase